MIGREPLPMTADYTEAVRTIRDRRLNAIPWARLDERCDQDGIGPIADSRGGSRHSGDSRFGEALYQANILATGMSTSGIASIVRVSERPACVTEE